MYLKSRGYVSTKRDADGTDSPYELNVTYLDALYGRAGEDTSIGAARFLCSQTIALVLRGIPAVYFNSLVAARNDHKEVEKTGRPRSINRKKWKVRTLSRLLNSAGTINSRVFGEYTRLLRLRAECPAFHPDGGQEILDMGESVFGVRRTSRDGGEVLLSVSNMAAEPSEVKVSYGGVGRAGSSLVDKISGREVDGTGRIGLGPYQTMWLVPQHPGQNTGKR